MKTHKIIKLVVVLAMMVISVNAQSGQTNLEETIKELTKVIQSNPGNAQAYRKRGNAYSELKNYNAAIKDFTSAIEINPQFAWAYHDRAYNYFLKSKFQDAVKDLEKAIKANGDISVFYYAHNEVYGTFVLDPSDRDEDWSIENWKASDGGEEGRNAQSKWSSAVDNYRKALNYQRRGRLFVEYKTGTADDALSNLGKAIELAPNYADSYYFRGVIYYDLKKYALAVADLAKSIEVDPTNKAVTETYYYRGLAYSELGKFDLAMADFEAATGLRPERQARIEWSRGQIYYKQEKYELAAIKFTKIIEYNSKFDEAYHLRGHSYNYLKKYDLAVADFTKAIELSDNAGHLYNDRANSYSSQKKFDLAVADFSKAIELDPKNSNAYGNRGYAHYFMGDYDKAVADFQKSLEIKPEGNSMIKEYLPLALAKKQNAVKEDKPVILYQENFSNNERQWYQEVGDDRLVAVTDGGYKIENKTLNFTYASKPISVNQEANFRIESISSKTNGVNNYGYGLVWGLKDSANYYTFIINGDGYFTFAKIKDNTLTATIPWTASNSINKLDSKNKLAILKKDKQIQFFVNDSLVGQAEFEPLFGNYIGFIVYNKQSISFDDLIVTTDGK